MNGVKAKYVRAGILIPLLAIALLIPLVAFAQPGGPNALNRGQSERAPTQPAVLVQAEAGNVTSLTITATRITSRWQGYYGNVTGNITLGDANNNILYNWIDASPRGEIYAVNDSAIPSWGDVFCFNFTNNLSDGQPRVQRFNGTDLENTLGISQQDVDGVDETFNRTYAGSFEVGGISIGAASGCSVVSLNVDDGYQEQTFNEVLLTDNNSMIYTSIIENSQTGFQGAPVDFQLIVGENSDTPAPTNYYFYVELT